MATVRAQTYDTAGRPVDGIVTLQRSGYKPYSCHTIAGRCTIHNVPPGTYTVLIETPDGAYLASDGLTLTAGDNQPLLLAISNDPPTGPPPGLAAGGGWPTWVKWVVVGVIVVVGAVVINEVTEDDETPGTPF